MYTIRKKYRIEMSHRLVSSYSEECQNIHGHSYIIEIFISSKKLNSDGMVMDFKFLNDKIKNMIMLWDHKIIMNREDPVLQLMSNKLESQLKFVDFNPTAENMARYFYDKIENILSEYDVKISKVRVHETETGYAEYKR